MRILDVISEAPVDDFQFLGPKDEENTFTRSDLKRLSDPNFEVKVRSFFRNSPWNFNLYFVNGHRPGHVQTLTRGRNINYIDSIDVDVGSDDYTQNVAGLISPQKAESIIRKLPPNHETSINMIYLNNDGDQKVGLTPWIVAHRLSHAFFINEKFMGRWRREIQNPFNDLIRKYHQMGYSNPRMLFHSRAAKTDNLPRMGEIIHEGMAYFILHNNFEIDTRIQNFSEDELNSLNQIVEKISSLYQETELSHQIR